MRWTKWMTVFVLLLVVAQGSAFGAEGAKWWQINNRFRVEWDDNIYQAENDKQDSWKFVEELELMVNLDLANTFVGLRYRPAFVYWTRRDNQNTDFQHDFDLVFNHAFTPRLALSVTDTLRRGMLPELQDGTTVVREEDDFTYNIANATMSYMLQPQSRLDFAGRYTLLRYDSSPAKDNDNYDIFSGGLTLRQIFTPKTTGLGDFRYEWVQYDGIDRDSQSLYLGLGAEQNFSRQLTGNARVGYQRKTFSDDDISAQNAPYAEGALTVLFTPTARLSGGIGYSMFESDIFPYANQDRTQAFLSFAWDITAKISSYLSGSWTHGRYKGDEAVINEQTVYADDGSEDIYQLGLRGTYKLNRNNWLELGWQYTDLDSDLRGPFKETRLDAGWKVQL